MGCIVQTHGATSLQKDCFFILESEYDAGAQVYKPNTATIYNALRQPNHTAIIQPTATRPLFAHTTTVDLQRDKIANLKTTFDNKKVIVVGGWRELRGNALRSLRQKTTPFKIYLVEDFQAERFLSEYPMFGADKHVPKRELPALLIDTNDFSQLIQPSSRFRLFAHPAVKSPFYQGLGIGEDSIIAEPADKATYKSYLLQKLMGHMQGSVLLQYNPTYISPGSLVDALSDFVTSRWPKCKPHEVKLYLNNNLEVGRGTPLFQSTSQARTDPTALTTGDKMEQLFLKLYKLTDPAKTERTYQILCRLLSNMIQNPQSASFRSVKGTNKPLIQNVLSYEAGKELISMVGFAQSEEGNWVNNASVDYLKLFLSELEMGYKQYLAASGQ